MTVIELIALLHTFPPDTEVRYEELGFGQPLPDIVNEYDFRLVTHLQKRFLLLPQIGQEYPE